ncbi:hypothetical protein T484DRAFT_3029213 [Baffinella frigidus]|nr:hypothetical protein T484DRAFT_3029213 [Cryptophyta sp. CCMP2293]
MHWSSSLSPPAAESTPAARINRMNVFGRRRSVSKLERAHATMQMGLRLRVCWRGCGTFLMRDTAKSWRVG